jgi:hypothetical protein
MFDLGSTSMLYYTQAMQHLDMIDMLLNGQPQFRFNRVMDKLFIDAVGSERQGQAKACGSSWKPTRQWIRPSSPSSGTSSGSSSTRRLSSSSSGVQNLKKFSGVALIGGVQINGQQLWDEASQELQVLDEELTEKWQAPPMFMMGRVEAPVVCRGSGHEGVLT